MDTGQLRAAQDVVMGALHSIAPGEWSAATPCDGWDVRALVDHLVTGNERFVMRLAGETPGPPPDRSHLTPTQVVHAYERTNTEVVAAFEQPGALDTVTQWPIGPLTGPDTLGLKITETLTHGWDLQRALGRSLPFDERTIEDAYDWAGPARERIPADRNPFGTPQPCPDDAPPLDRLAALLGRRL